MTFYNNPYFLIVTEKTGGLFDFDGTLPVVALQFVIIMLILNFILYTPLLDIIDERNVYVKQSLDEASEILTKSKQLNSKYESRVSKARQVVKLDLGIYQKLYKSALDEKLKSSQILIDNFISETTKNFDKNKENILTSFENEIETLSSQIFSKIVP